MKVPLSLLAGIPCVLLKMLFFGLMAAGDQVGVVGSYVLYHINSGVHTQTSTPNVEDFLEMGLESCEAMGVVISHKCFKGQTMNHRPTQLDLGQMFNNQSCILHSATGVLSWAALTWQVPMVLDLDSPHAY